MSLISRPSTSTPDERTFPSRISSHGHLLLPPISLPMGVPAIRCLSGRERISQTTNTLASPMASPGCVIPPLHLSCPTTPVAPNTASEKSETHQVSVPLPNKKKRRGKKRKSNPGPGLKTKALPGSIPPTSSSHSSHIVKHFESLYNKDTHLQVIPKKQQHDPRSPVTPTSPFTPMRNATPLRTFSLIREAQNEAKKTHEQDGAKARAQERLEQYRRAQEQAALDLRMSEEMKRSRRKEVRVALELAKQRKREEVYAANQVLALSEAARMRLILKSLEEGSLGREVIREDGSLQQRGV